MKDHVDPLGVYLFTLRNSLGNIGCVPDSELGWQVKMLNLWYQRLLDAEKV